MQTEYLYCLVVRDLVSRLVVLRRLLLFLGHHLGDSLNEGRFLRLLLYLRCLCLFVQFCLTRGGFNLDTEGGGGGEMAWAWGTSCCICYGYFDRCSRLLQ